MIAALILLNPELTLPALLVLLSLHELECQPVLLTDVGRDLVLLAGFILMEDDSTLQAVLLLAHRAHELRVLIVIDKGVFTIRRWAAGNLRM